MVSTTHPFNFDFKKSVQAIGVLLRSLPSQRMNYMRLLKLLYLADRQTLEATGRPITGSRNIAMERGPVVEEIFDLIRERHKNTRTFARFFTRDEYSLVMHRDPGVTYLTEFEVDALQKVAEDHKSRDEWEMVRFCHDNLKEWIENDPGKSSRPIPLEDILKALGMSECLQEIVESERERRSNADAMRALSAENRSVPAQ